MHGEKFDFYWCLLVYDVMFSSSEDFRVLNLCVIFVNSVNEPPET